jgi:lipopolysaccharide biosynthesis glycosyltransferase
MTSYNVTPTAAYTYAPAYRRYGHKINAVHFIGPNKPWANLKYRPAGTPNLSNQNPSYDCKSDTSKRSSRADDQTHTSLTDGMRYMTVTFDLGHRSARKADDSLYPST